MLRSWFAAVAVTGVWLATARVSTAQMCGDCDGDNRVMIAELLRAVNNALDPLAECGVGCFDSGTCPEVCIEFPERDGLRCETALCWYDDAQLSRCLRELHAAQPGVCSEVGP